MSIAEVTSITGELLTRNIDWVIAVYVRTHYKTNIFEATEYKDVVIDKVISKLFSFGLLVSPETILEVLEHLSLGVRRMRPSSSLKNLTQMITKRLHVELVVIRQYLVYGGNFFAIFCFTKLRGPVPRYECKETFHGIVFA